MNNFNAGSNCLASNLPSTSKEAITCNSENGNSKNSKLPNDNLSSICCEGVQLRFINDLTGRGIFATKNFTKGDLVLTDVPIVTCQFAWNQLYKYRACEYCLRALETAEENAQRLTGDPTIQLPYPECCETKKEEHDSCTNCDTWYCSYECKQRAWVEYHAILCPTSREVHETHPQKVLDTYWRLMHYPPETASIFLLVKLLVKLHLDKDGALRRRLGAFCSSPKSENEKLVHRLLGDEHLARIINLREMVKGVVDFPNIQEYLQPEAFLELFALLGRNGQGVGSSSFAAWVENLEKIEISKEEKVSLMETVDTIYAAMDGHVGHFLDNEGSALYPFQSWVNHSCVANTEVRFPYRNHIVGLVASKDILAGEEITISYLDLGDLQRSRYSRNKYLKEHYLFECHCPKCIEQADDPDVTSEEEDSDEDMEADEWSDAEGAPETEMSIV